jgi:adenylate kinase family enzyme
MRAEMQGAASHGCKSGSGSWYADRMTSQLERVIVVGTSCCGKTTFSRRFAEILKYPHIELDALYWGPHWVAKPVDEFRRLVESAVSRHRWVVDGNYGAVREAIWPTATLVIWLNYDFITVFRRAFIRTLRRSLSAEELYGGNRESLARAFLSRDSILWWVISTFKRRQRSYRELRETNRFPQLEWIELRKPVEAERFLQAILPVIY